MLAARTRGEILGHIAYVRCRRCKRASGKGREIFEKITERCFGGKSGAKVHFQDCMRSSNGDEQKCLGLLRKLHACAAKVVTQ